MQSICDPGQGWSNALLFVVFNQKIFPRLCPCLVFLGERCCKMLEKALLGPLSKLRSLKRKSVRPIKKRRAGTIEGVAREKAAVADERDALFSQDSVQSNRSVSSSVLYDSTAQTALLFGGGSSSLEQQTMKPKTPSINSKF